MASNGILRTGGVKQMKKAKYTDIWLDMYCKCKEISESG